MNKQRTAIYKMRRELLAGADVRARVMEWTNGIIGTLIETHCPPDAKQYDWDLKGLQSAILTQFGFRIDTQELGEVGRAELEETLFEQATRKYEDKEKRIPTEVLRETECMVMLTVIDNQWKDHLLSLDSLKEGIGLRGYGQKDPLIEYKKESFVLFSEMLDRIEDETLRYLFLIQPVVEQEMPERKEQPMYYQRAQGGGQVQTSRKARSVIPKKRKKKKKK